MRFMVGRKLSLNRWNMRGTSARHTCDVCRNLTADYVSLRIDSLDRSAMTNCAACRFIQTVLKTYGTVLDFDVIIRKRPWTLELRFCNGNFETVTLEIYAVEGMFTCTGRVPIFAPVS
jgi:hypothetical protein